MLMHVVRQLRPTHPIFNTVLGNLYADGTKYIAKHSDAETDLCSDAFIASLSLGAVRDFDLWDKKAKKRILRVALADGSLFIMGRNFQKKLQHDLPKRLRVKHARVNLTFRMIKE
jgi:alkylated DNA repair dioxygenase AlkB